MKTFDLLEFAEANRYRTRNLHDGRCVPPCKLDKRRRTGAQRRAEAFRSSSDGDRCDAIVGTHGCVFEQDGRLEWYVCQQQAPVQRVQAILKAGGILEQDGGNEMAGTAPVSAIGVVLAAIAAARVGVGRPGSPGNPETLRRHAAAKAKVRPEFGADGPGGTQHPRKSEWTPVPAVSLGSVVARANG